MPRLYIFKTENVWSLVEIVTQASGTRHCSSHNAPWVGSEKRYPMISYRTRSEHLVFRKKNILSSFSAKVRVSYEVCNSVKHNLFPTQHPTVCVLIYCNPIYARIVKNPYPTISKHYMITLKKCYAAHTDMNNNINTILLIDEPRIVWISPKLLTGDGTSD